MSYPRPFLFKSDSLDTFFHVVDFSFQEGVQPKSLVKFTRPFPPDAIPRSLPEQDPETCRVYFEQGVLGKEEFKAAIERLIPREWTESTPDLSPLLATALSQCRRHSPETPWWAINLKSCRQVKGRRLRNVAEGQKKYPITDALEPLSRSPMLPVREYLAREIQWHIQVRLVRDHELNRNDRISLLVSWDRSSGPGPGHSPYSDDVKSRTIHEMKELDARYKAIQETDGLIAEDRLKLFLLRFSHCLFLQQLRSVDLFRPSHDWLLTALSKPNVSITSNFLRQVTLISSHGEQLHHEVTTLTSVIESLLDILAPKLKKSDEFEALDLELRNLCRNLSLASSSLAPRLDNKLRFLEISRNIQESSSLWLLSLLAGIFLPLSLASSLLSMQSRLADLHYMLYDFCGVIVLLGTLTVITVQIIRRFAKWTGNIHDVFRVTDWVHWWFIIPEWTLVLSSFLVGMIKDVVLGLKILGYGTAVLIFTYLLTLYAVPRWRQWRAKKKEKGALARVDSS